MNKPTQSTLSAIAFCILFELLTIEIYNSAGVMPATRIMVISTVYYSLIIGNLLIRLHYVIDSKAFFIIVIVSNLALNSLILYFFCLFFTSLLLNSDFLLFYAPVGNTLLLLFDSFVLLHCEKTHEKKRLHVKFSVHCQCCGKGINILTAYCPYCYTISHKLNDTLAAFPNKHHLDFTETIYKQGKYCPHCGKPKGDRTWFNVSLVAPIRICSKCHHFYLDNSCIEWVFASLPRKCLVISTYLLAPCFLLLPIHSTLSDIPSTYLRLIVICIALLSYILVIRVLFKDITASQRRLEANPDYPQILKFMGYQHLANQNEQIKEPKN